MSRIDAKNRTRDKIRTAARERFLRSYEGTTMRQIARDAGLTTGAIFSLWAGKRALFQDLFGFDPEIEIITKANLVHMNLPDREFV